MPFRTVRYVLAAALAAASLLAATGCETDDDDECMNCCECSNDGSVLPPYRPVAPGDCSTCTEQCQALADREFMGQKFDNVKEIECPD